MYDYNSCTQQYTVRPFAMPVKTWIDEGIRVTFEADKTDVCYKLARAKHGTLTQL